jgi:hypothetical protein
MGFWFTWFFGVAGNCTGCFVGFDQLCCFRFVFLRRQGGVCHVCSLGITEKKFQHIRPSVPAQQAIIQS